MQERAACTHLINKREVVSDDLLAVRAVEVGLGQRHVEIKMKIVQIDAAGDKME
jgi:hypothetical protein